MLSLENIQERSYSKRYFLQSRRRKKVDKQEEIWWKVLYPEGKPKRKRGIQSTQVWVPSNVTNEVTQAVKIEDVAFKFVWAQRYPHWNRESRSWKPVGFKDKSDLVTRVQVVHPSNLFLCLNSNLLKYSRNALETRSEYCFQKR